MLFFSLVQKKQAPRRYITYLTVLALKNNFLSRKGDLYDEIKRIENTNSDTVFLLNLHILRQRKHLIKYAN